jgi:tetratricopeptide (TPR) repeat protein
MLALPGDSIIFLDDSMSVSTKFSIICWKLICILCLCTLAGCNLTATGQNLQGKRWFEQGNYAQAIASFQQALRSNPQDADAHYNLARTYHTVGRVQNNAQWTQQADQYYRQALTIDPSMIEANRGLAVLMIENNHTPEAFSLLRTWQTREPMSPEPLVELARLYKEHGNKQQAIQHLSDALQVDANSIRALRDMGQIRDEEGNYQLALANYTRAYNLNTMQTDLAQRIAQLNGTVADQPNHLQSGQTRLGAANQFVPR